MKLKQIREKYANEFQNIGQLEKTLWQTITQEGGLNNLPSWKASCNLSMELTRLGEKLLREKDFEQAELYLSRAQQFTEPAEDRTLWIHQTEWFYQRISIALNLNIIYMKEKRLASSYDLLSKITEQCEKSHLWDGIWKNIESNIDVAYFQLLCTSMEQNKFTFAFSSARKAISIIDYYEKESQNLQTKDEQQKVQSYTERTITEKYFKILSRKLLLRTYCYYQGGRALYKSGEKQSALKFFKMAWKQGSEYLSQQDSKLNAFLQKYIRVRDELDFNRRLQDHSIDDFIKFTLEVNQQQKNKESNNDKETDQTMLEKQRFSYQLQVDQEEGNDDNNNNQEQLIRSHADSFKPSKRQEKGVLRRSESAQFAKASSNKQSGVSAKSSAKRGIINAFSENNTPLVSARSAFHLLKDNLPSNNLANGNKLPTNQKKKSTKKRPQSTFTDLKKGNPKIKSLEGLSLNSSSGLSDDNLDSSIILLTGNNDNFIDSKKVTSPQHKGVQQSDKISFEDMLMQFHFPPSRNSDRQNTKILKKRPSTGINLKRKAVSQDQHRIQGFSTGGTTASQISTVEAEKSQQIRKQLGNYLQNPTGGRNSSLSVKKIRKYYEQVFGKSKDGGETSEQKEEGNNIKMNKEIVPKNNINVSSQQQINNLLISPKSGGSQSGIMNSASAKLFINSMFSRSMHHTTSNQNSKRISQSMHNEVNKQQNVQQFLQSQQVQSLSTTMNKNSKPGSLHANSNILYSPNNLFSQITSPQSSLHQESKQDSKSPERHSRQQYQQQNQHQNSNRLISPHPKQISHCGKQADKIQVSSKQYYFGTLSNQCKKGSIMNSSQQSQLLQQAKQSQIYAQIDKIYANDKSLQLKLTSNSLSNNNNINKQFQPIQLSFSQQQQVNQTVTAVPKPVKQESSIDPKLLQAANASKLSMMILARPVYRQQLNSNPPQTFIPKSQKQVDLQNLSLKYQQLIDGTFDKEINTTNKQQVSQDTPFLPQPPNNTMPQVAVLPDFDVSQPSNIVSTSGGAPRGRQNSDSVSQSVNNPPPPPPLKPSKLRRMDTTSFSNLTPHQIQQYYQQKKTNLQQSTLQPNITTISSSTQQLNSQQQLQPTISQQQLSIEKRTSPLQKSNSVANLQRVASKKIITTNLVPQQVQEKQILSKINMKTTVSLAVMPEDELDREYDAIQKFKSNHEQDISSNEVDSASHSRNRQQSHYNISANQQITNQDDNNNVFIQKSILYSTKNNSSSGFGGANITIDDIKRRSLSASLLLDVKQEDLQEQEKLSLTLFTIEIPSIKFKKSSLKKSKSTQILSNNLILRSRKQQRKEIMLKILEKLNQKEREKNEKLYKAAFLIQQFWRECLQQKYRLNASDEMLDHNFDSQAQCISNQGTTSIMQRQNSMSGQLSGGITYSNINNIPNSSSFKFKKPSPYSNTKIVTSESILANNNNLLANHKQSDKSSQSLISITKKTSMIGKTNTPSKYVKSQHFFPNALELPTQSAILNTQQAIVTPSTFHTKQAGQSKNFMSFFKDPRKKKQAIEARQFLIQMQQGESAPLRFYLSHCQKGLSFWKVNDYVADFNIKGEEVFVKLRFIVKVLKFEGMFRLNLKLNLPELIRISKLANLNKWSIANVLLSHFLKTPQLEKKWEEYSLGVSSLERPSSFLLLAIEESDKLLLQKVQGSQYLSSSGTQIQISNQQSNSNQKLEGEFGNNFSPMIQVFEKLSFLMSTQALFVKKISGEILEMSDQLSNCMTPYIQQGNQTSRPVSSTSILDNGNKRQTQYESNLLYLRTFLKKRKNVVRLLTSKTNYFSAVMLKHKNTAQFKATSLVSDESLSLSESKEFSSYCSIDDKLSEKRTSSRMLSLQLSQANPTSNPSLFKENHQKDKYQKMQSEEVSLLQKTQARIEEPKDTLISNSIFVGNEKDKVRPQQYAQTPQEIRKVGKKLTFLNQMNASLQLNTPRQNTQTQYNDTESSGIMNKKAENYPKNNESLFQSVRSAGAKNSTLSLQQSPAQSTLLNKNQARRNSLFFQKVAESRFSLEKKNNSNSNNNTNYNNSGQQVDSTRNIVRAESIVFSSHPQDDSDHSQSPSPVNQQQNEMMRSQQFQRSEFSPQVGTMISNYPSYTHSKFSIFNKDFKDEGTNSSIVNPMLQSVKRSEIYKKNSEQVDTLLNSEVSLQQVQSYQSLYQPPNMNRLDLSVYNNNFNNFTTNTNNANNNNSNYMNNNFVEEKKSPQLEEQLMYQSFAPKRQLEIGGKTATILEEENNIDEFVPKQWNYKQNRPFKNQSNLDKYERKNKQARLIKERLHNYIFWSQYQYFEEYVNNKYIYIPDSYVNPFYQKYQFIIVCVYIIMIFYSEILLKTLVKKNKDFFIAILRIKSSQQHEEFININNRTGIDIVLEVFQTRIKAKWFDHMSLNLFLFLDEFFPSNDLDILQEQINEEDAGEKQGFHLNYRFQRAFKFNKVTAYLDIQFICLFFQFLYNRGFNSKQSILVIKQLKGKINIENCKLSLIQTTKYKQQLLQGLQTPQIEQSQIKQPNTPTIPPLTNNPYADKYTMQLDKDEVIENSTYEEQFTSIFNVSNEIINSCDEKKQEYFRQLKEELTLFMTPKERSQEMDIDLIKKMLIDDEEEQNELKSILFHNNDNENLVQQTYHICNTKCENPCQFKFQRNFSILNSNLQTKNQSQLQNIPKVRIDGKPQRPRTNSLPGTTVQFKNIPRKSVNFLGLLEKRGSSGDGAKRSLTSPFTLITQILKVSAKLKQGIVKIERNVNKTLVDQNNEHFSRVNECTLVTHGDIRVLEYYNTPVKMELTNYKAMYCFRDPQSGYIQSLKVKFVREKVIGSYGEGELIANVMIEDRLNQLNCLKVCIRGQENIEKLINVIQYSLETKINVIRQNMIQKHLGFFKRLYFRSFIERNKESHLTKILQKYNEKDEALYDLLKNSNNLLNDPTYLQLYLTRIKFTLISNFLSSHAHEQNFLLSTYFLSAKCAQTAYIKDMGRVIIQTVVYASNPMFTSDRSIFLCLHIFSKKMRNSYSKLILTIQDVQYLISKDFTVDTCLEKEKIIKVVALISEKLAYFNQKQFFNFKIPLSSLTKSSKKSRYDLLNSFDLIPEPLAITNSILSNKTLLTPVLSSQKVVYSQVKKIHNNYTIFTIRRYGILDFYQIEVYIPKNGRKWSTNIFVSDLWKLSSSLMEDIFPYSYWQHPNVMEIIRSYKRDRYINFTAKYVENIQSDPTSYINEINEYQQQHDQKFYSSTSYNSSTKFKYQKFYEQYSSAISSFNIAQGVNNNAQNQTFGQQQSQQYLQQQKSLQQQKQQQWYQQQRPMSLSQREIKQRVYSMQSDHCLQDKQISSFKSTLSNNIDTPTFIFNNQRHPSILKNLNNNQSAFAAGMASGSEVESQETIRSSQFVSSSQQQKLQSRQKISRISLNKQLTFNEFLKNNDYLKSPKVNQADKFKSESEAIIESDPYYQQYLLEYQALSQQPMQLKQSSESYKSNPSKFLKIFNKSLIGPTDVLEIKVWEQLIERMQIRVNEQNKIILILDTFKNILKEVLGTFIVHLRSEDNVQIQISLEKKTTNKSIPTSSKQQRSPQNTSPLNVSEQKFKEQSPIEKNLSHFKGKSKQASSIVARQPKQINEDVSKLNKSNLKTLGSSLNDISPNVRKVDFSLSSEEGISRSPSISSNSSHQIFINNNVSTYQQSLVNQQPLDESNQFTAYKQVRHIYEMELLEKDMFGNCVSLYLEEAMKYDVYIRLNFFEKLQTENEKLSMNLLLQQYFKANSIHLGQFTERFRSKQASAAPKKLIQKPPTTRRKPAQNFLQQTLKSKLPIGKIQQYNGPESSDDDTPASKDGNGNSSKVMFSENYCFVQSDFLLMASMIKNLIRENYLPSSLYQDEEYYLQQQKKQGKAFKHFESILSQNRKRRTTFQSGQNEESPTEENKQNKKSFLAPNTYQSDQIPQKFNQNFSFSELVQSPQTTSSNQIDFKKQLLLQVKKPAQSILKSIILAQPSYFSSLEEAVKYEPKVKINCDVSIQRLVDPKQKHFIMMFRGVFTRRPLQMIAIYYNAQKKKFYAEIWNVQTQQKAKQVIKFSQICYQIPCVKQLLQVKQYSEIGRRIFLSFKNKLMIETYYVVNS